MAQSIPSVPIPSPWHFSGIFHFFFGKAANAGSYKNPTVGLNFICMTIQVHTEAIFRIKITPQGNYVTLVIICHAEIYFMNGILIK